MPTIATGLREYVPLWAHGFPNIDVALLPIGPVLPREFVTRSHIDGREAVEAFLLLGAKTMVPIHYDTFAHGADEPGVALARFREAVAARGLSPDQARILPIGGQNEVLTAPTVASEVDHAIDAQDPALDAPSVTVTPVLGVGYVGLVGHF